MKKLTLILSVVLCLAMLFTFASCGSTDDTKETTAAVSDAASSEAASSEAETETPKDPEDLIIGEWEGKLDMSEILAMSMGDMDGEYFDDLKFDVIMLLEINEDGSYTLSADKDAIIDSIDDLKDDLKDGMKAMIEDMADAYGLAIEDLIAGYDSLDEYVEASLSELDADALAEGIGVTSESGTYEINGDKITMTPDDNDAEAEENLITIDGDKLKVDITDEAKAELSEDELAMAEMFFPMVFDKK